MKDTQQVTASLAVTDSKLQPVAQPTFDSPPAWTIDNPAVATLTPSADGLSCLLVASLPGVANLTVSATASGQAFAGTLPVQVTVGDAAAISISLGTPVDQPVAAAPQAKK